MYGAYLEVHGNPFKAPKGGSPSRVPTEAVDARNPMGQQGLGLRG